MTDFFHGKKITISPALHHKEQRQRRKRSDRSLPWTTSSPHCLAPYSNFPKDPKDQNMSLLAKLPPNAGAQASQTLPTCPVECLLESGPNTWWLAYHHLPVPHHSGWGTVLQRSTGTQRHIGHHFVWHLLRDVDPCIAENWSSRRDISPPHISALPPFLSSRPSSMHHSSILRNKTLWCCFIFVSNNWSTSTGMSDCSEAVTRPHCPCTPESRLEGLLNCRVSQRSRTPTPNLYPPWNTKPWRKSPAWDSLAPKQLPCPFPQSPRAVTCHMAA